MARHDDTAELDAPKLGDDVESLEPHASSEVDLEHDVPPSDDEIVNGGDGQGRTNGGEDHKPTLWKRLASPAGAIAVCSIALIALGAIAGLLGQRVYDQRQARDESELFVQAARQGVVNLTAIHYTTVDADIKRILDSSTGSFHDDFERRAQPFAEVVKKAQTNSDGTVTNAALQTQNGNQAKVLVTVSMKMSNVGAPEQPPRSWRMVIEVEKTGDTAKVSNVQFAT
jgi:Mce-associated membrane protein